MMGFHRLGITDPKHASMQPFTNDRYAVSVNGEIYNYEKIYEYLDMMVEAGLFQYTRTSKSDCEAVLHLWTFFTQNVENPTNHHLSQMCRDLDGEYAIVSDIIPPTRSGVIVAISGQGFKQDFFKAPAKANGTKYNAQNEEADLPD